MTDYQEIIRYEDIVSAGETVQEAGLTTPSLRSQSLSDLCDTDIWLKLENLQPTGSFKVRGALIKLLSLDEAARKAGVIAMSAGNHAQGVAYHAKQLGIPATIVMPRNTPFTKISRTEQLGAKVVLNGETLSESQSVADEIAQSESLTFVHPYDDPAIIAGQGTAALEFLAAHPDLDVLVVPIGGGGLISGIALAAKAIKPEIDIIGVEAARYPSMFNAVRMEDLACGGQTVAEGIAVKAAGEITRRIISELVSDLILIDEDQLEEAMQIYLRRQNLVVEGAGAATLAAVLQDKERFSGRSIGLIVSGGNADSRLLSSVLLRGLVREGRLVRIRIEISDEPGALSNLTETIGAHGGNIVEVMHQRLFYDISVKSTDVDISLETRDRGHVQEIIGALTDAGYPTRLLSSTADEE